MWDGMLGDGGAGIVNQFLTIPFVLLLGYAGQLADRVAKHRQIIATRIAEVPIAMLALVGFWLGNAWIVMAAFILLASESAFFGPAKYGCVPEIVDQDQVNRANGFMTLATNLGILLGVGIGGPLLQFYPGMVGVVLVGMSVIGLTSSLFMHGLRPIAPGSKFQWTPHGPYVDTLRLVRKTMLWDTMLVWSWFYAAAIVVLAILPEYKVPLGITETQVSLLLGAIGLGIGIGCLAAGFLSGGRINGRLSVAGGFSTGAIFYLLGVLHPDTLPFPWLLVVLLLLGASGGFFLIPLQAILQLCSPPAERARVLATANALSFVLMSVASGIYWLAASSLDMSPNRASIGCGVLMLGVSAWMTFGGGRRILLARAPDSTA
jgi:acyl-[acyl-carrier-protein]-phospholipid O-acyltransferase/long-chain-fatty-acid--[acyl-carrier-protein] ligase